MKAPSIVFAMLPESGHLNPSYKLAKALRARGHDVRYLAIADVRAQIEAQGFAVEPLYPDLFPSGLLGAEQKLGTLARRRAITTRYRTLLERLRTDAPLASPPALLVVDVTQVHFALWARRVGVPIVLVNTSLPQTRDPGVPPLRSSSPYAASLLARVRPALEWRRFVAKRQLSAHAADLAGMCPPYELARREALRLGVAEHDLDSETVYMPQLRGVPELVLCPRAFDFPRAPAPERAYVESIDLSRSEPEFAWGGLSADKPLIYCALGGQRYRAGDVPSFFRRLHSVFRTRPQWQLLLAAGQHMASDELDPLPNVAVVERAPQLAVLRRARLMITHGGLGSVKECIMNAVPMLGVPLDVDQPGNVARVVFHGLGLSADVRSSSERALRLTLDRLLSTPSFAICAREMQGRFVREEAGERGADLVERLLSGTAAPVSATAS
jgi:zeaxanthin glucosyltransferase